MSFWKKKDEQERTPEKVSSTETQKPEVLSEEAKEAKEVKKEAAPEEKPAVQKEPESRFGNVRSALGKGTVIQGKLSFDTPVRIDGKLSGEVYSTETIIVGPTGEIDAKIEVKNLVVMGLVKGAISASDKIEIHQGGSIEAEVFTQSISMEEGAIFNGACSMGTEKVATISNEKEEEKPAKEASKKKDKDTAKPKSSTEVRVH